MFYWQRSLFQGILRVRTASFYFVLLGLFCRPTISGEPASPKQWEPDKGVFAEFKAETCGAPFIITSVLEGTDRGLRLAVDTGCEQTLFDPQSLNQRMSGGTVITASTEIAKVSVGQIAPVSLRTGSTILTSKGKMLRMNLTSMNKQAGMQLDGILGVDCMSSYMWHFDWRNRRLLICDPIKAPPPPGIRVPMGTSNGMPSIDVRIPGYGDVECVIDTCAFNSMSFSRPLFSELVDRDLIRIMPSNDKELDAAGNLARTQLGLCQSIVVADSQHSNVRVHAGRVNRIGAFILMRYAITCDFSAHVCSLSAHHRPPEYDFGDCDGIAFSICSDGRKAMGKVDSEGAAFQAGLRANDIVMAINDKPANKWSITELQMMWVEARSTKEDMVIAIYRGGQTKRYVIRGTSLGRTFGGISKLP